MKRLQVDVILDFEADDDGNVSVCIDHGPGETSGGVHRIARERLPELIAFLQAVNEQRTPEQDAALQELVDQAQELDMGYGTPTRDNR